MNKINLSHSGFFTITASCLAVDSVRLMILGDWGGLPNIPYHTAIEMGVAKQMSTVAKKFGPEAILALGDNFYFDGVKNSYDKRFEVGKVHVQCIRIEFDFCIMNTL